MGGLSRFFALHPRRACGIIPLYIVNKPRPGRNEREEPPHEEKRPRRPPLRAAAPFLAGLFLFGLLAALLPALPVRADDVINLGSLNDSTGNTGTGWSYAAGSSPRQLEITADGTYRVTGNASAAAPSFRGIAVGNGCTVTLDIANVVIYNGNAGGTPFPALAIGINNSHVTLRLNSSNILAGQNGNDSGGGVRITSGGQPGIQLQNSATSSLTITGGGSLNVTGGNGTNTSAPGFTGYTGGDGGSLTVNAGVLIAAGGGEAADIGGGFAGINGGANAAYTQRGGFVTAAVNGIGTGGAAGTAANDTVITGGSLWVPAGPDKIKRAPVDGSGSSLFPVLVGAENNLTGASLYGLDVHAPGGYEAATVAGADAQNQHLTGTAIDSQWPAGAAAILWLPAGDGVRYTTPLTVGGYSHGLADVTAHYPAGYPLITDSENVLFFDLLSAPLTAAMAKGDYYTAESWATFMQKRDEAAAADLLVATDRNKRQQLAGELAAAQSALRIRLEVATQNGGAPRVGVPLTLTPAKDSQSGGTGWAWDAEYLGEGSFNSPATFTPVKAGTSAVTFTDADGEVGSLALTILPAAAPEPAPTPGDNTGTGARTPGDEGAPWLWLTLLLWLGGSGMVLLIVRRKRMRQD